VLLPHADPIHKVTIILRGMALGLTQQLPVDETHHYSKEYLDDQFAMLTGGRTAEEIATVGITEAVGPLTVGKKEEPILFGREIAQHQDYSEDAAWRIDQEVKRIVSANYERAHRILVEYKVVLVNIADELLTREVLDGEQVRRMVRGLSLNAPQPAAHRAARFPFAQSGNSATD
jgi:cell division protease FtsH